MAKEEWKPLDSLNSIWSLFADFADWGSAKDASDPEVRDKIEKGRAKYRRGRRPRPSPTLTAWTYVTAVLDLCGHLLTILAICWASWKFSESHEKIVDSCSRTRFYATLTLLPLVLFNSIKHWYQGTHFPLTASRSFQVLVRDWWTLESEKELKGIDILQWLGIGIFFCYIGLWNFWLLLQRRGDLDTFDPAARLLVPLLIFTSVIRMKSTMLALLFFGLVAVATALLLCGAGVVMVILMLIWLAVTFEGRHSEVTLSFTVTQLHDVIRFFYMNM